MLSVALGADHAGWELKEALKAWLMDAGYQILDFGTHSPDSVDYPDYALQVAEAVTVQVFTTTTRARAGSSVRTIPEEARSASMAAESYWLSLQPRVTTW